MVTVRPTYQLNYKLENYFDTDIPKKFENQTKTTKDIGKYVKIAKNLQKDSPIAMEVFLKRHLN